ncbi:MAG: hypothetical protein J5993_05585 [Clostridia bacterium]|nr:hypothetical protein [Clostridia bacterium]
MKSFSIYRFARAKRRAAPTPETNEPVPPYKNAPVPPSESTASVSPYKNDHVSVLSDFYARHESASNRIEKSHTKR